MAPPRVLNPPGALGSGTFGAPAMSLLSQRGTRIAVTLVPVLLVLLHAVGVWPLDLLQRLDNIIHDTRLRATLVHTLEPRIVIVDIDEQSLAEVGRWFTLSEPTTDTLMGR